MTMLAHFKTNNFKKIVKNVTFYTRVNNLKKLLLVKLLCLAFYDKVNCKQITNIVWPLLSRRTVNKSLTKPDVIASQSTVSRRRAPCRQSRFGN